MHATAQPTQIETWCSSENCSFRKPTRADMSWGLRRHGMGPRGQSFVHPFLQIALAALEAWGAMWRENPARHALPNAASTLVTTVSDAWWTEHRSDDQGSSRAHR